MKIDAPGLPVALVKPPPRAIFFDAGDTLVAPYPSFAGVFAQACCDAGLSLSEAEAQPIESWISREWTAWRAAGRRYSTSTPDSRRFWEGLYLRFLAERGLTAPPDLPPRIYDRFVESRSYRAFPDVAPALGALRDRGFLLGVISNWEEWLPRLLQDLDLLPYFSAVVVSGVEGREKPDPALFEAALRRLNVPAASALHVGDSPETDYAAAVAVGMQAVLLDRRGHRADFPYPRITDLTQLLALLAE